MVDLRTLHAALVQEMNHWEHEQVYLSDGPDKDYARRRFNDLVNRAAVIKRRIAEGETEGRYDRR